MNPSLSRRELLRRTGIALVASGVSDWGLSTGSARAAARGDTIVVQWNAAALQGVRESKLGPPMVARALAVIHTAIYDAWAPFDPVAAPAVSRNALRRPRSEHTMARKHEAISYAAYRTATDLFPTSRGTVFDPLMKRLGYDPDDETRALDLPRGIGNRAAARLIAQRHHDGSNQLGDEPGGIGTPYADTTGYTARNEPMDTRRPFDQSLVRDPAHWQPLIVPDAAGVPRVQRFVGAQWAGVSPFVLPGAVVARSTPPPAFGTAEFERQAHDLVALSAGLTDEQKLVAEYWADGPSSELPPGHWSLHGQFVSRRDRHDLDRDVKLFYALTTAVADAGICCWFAKRRYDAVRPVTAVRYLFRDSPIRAWAGPGLGTRTIPGGSWLPYQPVTFPTPPFPEYTSGHSTFSAAGAEILRLFTGSSRFGASVTFAPGSSRVEPGLVPGREVTLSWPTFADAADEAGYSRRYGGIHFESADLEGRAAGRRVARAVWQRSLAQFAGAQVRRDLRP